MCHPWRWHTFCVSSLCWNVCECHSGFKYAMPWTKFLTYMMNWFNRESYSHCYEWKWRHNSTLLKCAHFDKSALIETGHVFHVYEIVLNTKMHASVFKLIYIFLILLTYLRCRVMQKTSVCWFTCQTPAVPKTELHLNTGMRKSTQVSCMGGRNLMTWATVAPQKGLHQWEAGIQSCVQVSNSGTLV